VALGKEALYACYRRVEQPLYNVIYRWLWQPQDCQDLIQEAFLRVWTRRDRVDESRLDRLVWTAALNLARNRLRWRSLRRYAGLEADLPSADDPAAAAERAQRDALLRAALRKLPPKMRQVLLLSEFGGLDTTQIAAILNIPPGTVGSRKHEALKRLRATLENRSHD
jgi:RNA polymerase sigma-70 factor (ECF subfamily)